jgi:hypothetical protein
MHGRKRITYTHYSMHLVHAGNYFTVSPSEPLGSHLKVF